MRTTYLALATIYVGIVGVAACSDHAYNPNGPAADPNAPTIHITTPARGSFAGDVQTVTVTGTATDDHAVVSVTVNDVPATLAADGTWTAVVPVVAGTNLLHAVAKDASNNAGKATRAVVAGPMVPIGTKVPNALTATLSAQTFAAIAKMAQNFMTTGDLESIVAPHNPVLDLNQGHTCLYAKASITSMSIGGANVSLVPQTGAIALDVELDNLSIGMHIEYAVACISGSTDITVSASHVSVSGDLTMGVTNGAFDIALANPNVTITGFDLQGGLPGAILDLLNLDSALGSILGWAIEKFVVPMLDNALAGLNSAKTIDVLGTPVDVLVSPSNITVSSDGAIIELDTSLRAHGDSGAPGFVSVPNQVPAMDLSHGFQLAVAANAANEFFTSLWAAKGLDKTIMLNAGSYGDVGKLFDSVEIAAAVPPYVDASGHGLVLTIGDLMATFKSGEIIATEVAINAQVDLVVTNDPMTGALKLDVGMPTTYVDVLDASDGVSGANQLSSAQFDAIASFAMGRIIAVGSGSVGAIPLPTIAGVSVTNLTVGEQTGYVVVDGAIQ
jgi:hypothetical protein